MDMLTVKTVCAKSHKPHWTIGIMPYGISRVLLGEGCITNLLLIWILFVILMLIGPAIPFPSQATPLVVITPLLEVFM